MGAKIPDNMFVLGYDNYETSEIISEKIETANAKNAIL